MNQRLARHVFWPLTERLCRRDTMDRLGDLLRCEAMSDDEIAHLQSKKLQRIMIVAARYCPFYTQKMKEAGIDPNQRSFSFDDLARMPVVGRDDIATNLDRMTWWNCPRGGPQPYSTGGSSGKALKFHFDRFRQSADQAARMRARLWWDVRPGDTEILLWGAPIELKSQDRLRQWRDSLLNQYILNAFNMTDERMGHYIDFIQQHRPTCLYGYASSLALLARFARDHGIAPGGLGSDKLKAVFVTGEVLFDADREAIERAFAAPAVIEYGCRDGGFLAHEHPDGFLHVARENALLELVGSDGQPVGPGEIGEVVITHLDAMAMPLIRYRIGDLARAAHPLHIDTLTYPEKLTEVRGRVTDQIICRQGNDYKRMHALSLIYVLREADGLQQFRIVQRAVDELLVEVVTDEAFTPEIAEAVLVGLRQRMGPQAQIEIRRRQRLDNNAAGKHACVVSQIQS